MNKKRKQQYQIWKTPPPPPEYGVGPDAEPSPPLNEFKELLPILTRENPPPPPGAEPLLLAPPNPPCPTETSITSFFKNENVVELYNPGAPAPPSEPASAPPAARAEPAPARRPAPTPQASPVAKYMAAAAAARKIQDPVQRAAEMEKVKQSGMEIWAKSNPKLAAIYFHFPKHESYQYIHLKS